VGPETVVGLLAERGGDLLTAILGVWKAGGAYLPLDPAHPARRHTQVLGQSAAPLVLVAEGLLPVLEEAVAELPVEGRPELLGLAEALTANVANVADVAALSGSPAPVAGGGLAYVIYTSGSTGLPKGAMVEQRGMVNHLFAKIRDLDLGPADTVAQTASQCFDISVWQMFAGLAAGGRVRVFGDDVAHDPARLLDGVEADGVTVLELVPSLERALLDEIAARDTGNGAAAPAFDRLRFLIPTGEALPPDLCRRWLARYPGVPEVNAYGPTECSDDVTHALLRQPPSPGAVRVPIGRPVANLRLAVFDRGFEVAPIGVAGELCVGGVGVGRGYLHDPVRTAAVFVPDLLSPEPGARLYRTGDLARWLVSGDLDFLGRLDHQVKVRGFRIELGEIEAALAESPGVREAAVLAVASGRDPADRVLVAYLVPAGETALDERELRDSLRQGLPEYMVPSAFVQLPALPLSDNGKLDRRALLALGGAEPATREAYVAPRTPVEETLAAIWSEVLRRERIGVDDNFFEVGGHSLLVTQVVSRLRGSLGIDLPLRALFEAPTIAGLAERIETVLWARRAPDPVGAGVGEEEGEL
ncbi:MAG TPA: amino acid adenylation domain-containing protein, partial [Thermoanaerobaculia bacterium]|nr:amino acid adenylation domain-containing protein [Thermoanaerobaculia bacterium]